MSGQAIPDTVTVRDLSGRWYLDLSLSDKTDECLSLQKISWLLQKAIRMANITLVVRHKGENLDIDNVAAAQSFTATETRVLNWVPREIKMSLFGRISGRSRILHFEGVVTVAKFDFEVDEVPETDEDLAWLTGDWLRADDGSLDLLESQGTSLDVGWRMHQLWGFQMIDGERRHVRKMCCWRDGKKVNATSVYQWLGPLADK